MSGPLDAAAIARITALVLGEPAEYTREQAVDLVGTTVERSRAYWRAFGFADVGRARAFTPEDIACMRLLVGLVDTLGKTLAPELMRLFLAPSPARQTGAALASMLVYIAMAAILAFRPSGLFPQRAR